MFIWAVNSTLYFTPKKMCMMSAIDQEDSWRNLTGGGPYMTEKIPGIVTLCVILVMTIQ